ncbi:hypothetical protein IGB42_00319 [Andreprevotia sp. IGB-42]|uniref:alpha/beta hydrolase n=1 Tax=Andreprevotia sp. IGB-42 TaxID=2497473 RepID=UPI00135A7924|nr:alpha/beta fold hydrolase [Andreprevotia sp. IGB-42]KAF0815241.1 hypothetical protein IGB42_00319 [Andreprevotia sp. IGB-42]
MSAIHRYAHSGHAIRAALLTSLLIAAGIAIAAPATSRAKAARVSPVAVASNPTPKPVPAGRVVSFQTDDGVTLSGVQYGPADGTRVVIFSHQYNRDQSSWLPLAVRLGDAGYTVLTYNFRGYAPSTGKVDVAMLGQDLKAAVGYARAHGATQLVLVGASMGGLVTVPVALEVQPVAYVVIGAPGAFGGIAATDQALQASTAAKLFINSKYDSYLADTRRMHDAVADRSEIDIYPTGLHGADLLEGPDGEAVQQRIAGFIAAHLPL